MKIEQNLYGCLPKAHIYIESDGEAAVNRSLREVQPLYEKCSRRNA